VSGWITVRSDVPLDRAQETLLHEVLHALLDQIGHGHEEWAEPLVWRLSVALLDLVQRNPELLTFLCPDE